MQYYVRAKLQLMILKLLHEVQRSADLKTTQIIFLSRIKLSKLFLKVLTLGDSWTRFGKSFHLDTDRTVKNCRLISVLGASGTRPKASLGVLSVMVVALLVAC